MSENKVIALNYFSVFSNKDLEGLAELLAEDVSLKDWELNSDGKEAVLAATKNIFDAVNKIEVEPVLLVEEGDYVAAQLKILINDQEYLHVMDLLKFNSDRKISSIVAFKG
jgi:ketosteroid isomerase-like protein